MEISDALDEKISTSRPILKNYSNFIVSLELDLIQGLKISMSDYWDAATKLQPLLKCWSPNFYPQLPKYLSVDYLKNNF